MDRQSANRSLCSKENTFDTVKQFIGDLQREALSSKAVYHPYLEDLCAGLPQQKMADFRDFAFQYGIYSVRFASYVQSVIAALSQEHHRNILLENLREEQGSTHDVELPPDILATVVGQPHSKLFLRFQQALGVEQVESSEKMVREPGYIWAKAFAQLCSQNEYVGIGAIGFGTELIVSKIYRQILSGLRAHTSLTPVEHVFFDLHSECDDEHAEQILSICRDLATDPDKRELIAYGAKKALQLRIEFWDAMYERVKSHADIENRLSVKGSV